MDRDAHTSLFVAEDYSPRDLERAPIWLTGMLDWMLEPIDPEVCSASQVAGAIAELRDRIDGLVPSSPDLHAIGSAVDDLQELGRLLHESGAGAPTQSGMLVQINTSDGGVPKTAVTSADIARRGLLGDKQANRKHHGRPFQAVCLWSADVIDALRGEGHPVRPGAAGENLTVGGIDWTTLRPGVRILVGQVLCELSAWATPCRNNDQWFTDRSDRIDHDLHPGWSRVYAWVLEAGAVQAGDPVVVEP